MTHRFAVLSQRAPVFELLEGVPQSGAEVIPFSFCLAEQFDVAIPFASESSKLVESGRWATTIVWLRGADSARDAIRAVMTSRRVGDRRLRERLC